MRRFLTLLGLMAVASAATAAPSSARDSGSQLRGVVVTNECAAPIKNVRVGVSYKGNIRSSVTKTDAAGYFEINLAQLYPNWAPDAAVMLSFEKEDYVKKHKNILPTSFNLEEVPLVKEQRADAEATRFSAFAEHRKDDCSSWTVFAVPHKTNQDVRFPSDDQAQEMHFRLSTHFQQLDLPLDKVPSVSLELLAKAQDLSLAGDGAGDFGAYLNALGVLYGNVEAGSSVSGKTKAEPQVSSYMQIVSSLKSKIGATKVAHRVPEHLLEKDIFEEGSDYIDSLTRASLLAVVSREFERVTGIPNRPDYHVKLQRIRDFIIAERKNYPAPAAQSRSEQSTFRVLTQLATLVEQAISDGQSSDKTRTIMAEIVE